jgi:hypothetical protein
MKNSPNHRLQLPFSGRCCAKNTQLVPPLWAAGIAQAGRIIPNYISETMA